MKFEYNLLVRYNQIMTVVQRCANIYLYITYLSIAIRAETLYSVETLELTCEEHDQSRASLHACADPESFVRVGSNFDNVFFYYFLFGEE